MTFSAVGFLFSCLSLVSALLWVLRFGSSLSLLMVGRMMHSGLSLWCLVTALLNGTWTSRCGNVVTTANVIQVVNGRECIFNSSQPGIVSPIFNYEGNLVLTTQDQINAVFAGCTSLVDGVVIHPNFTGTTVDFRNLTKMGGVFIETNAVTTILLDNLEDTDAIVYIVDNATITTLSAPKLKRAQWLGFSATMSNLSLPVLERIE